MRHEPEVILSRIASELKPEVDQLVAEIGREQVIANALKGLARLAERRAARDSEGTP